jgi:hypothetical protein
LIWANENNKKIIPKLSKISEKGDIQTFKWVLENMSIKVNESNLNIINFAAKSGHLEFVKMLHGIGWPFDCYTWNYATCNGNLELLKWLHSNGCPIPPYAYGEAPRNGYLHVIQWIKEQKLPGEDAACYSAALYGQLSCFKWMIDNGFNYNKEDCCKAAIISGSMEIVEKYRDGIDKQKIFCWAEESGRKESLEFVMKEGWNWDSTHAKIFIPEITLQNPQLIPWAIKKNFKLNFSELVTKAKTSRKTYSSSKEFANYEWLEIQCEKQLKGQQQC